MVERGVQDEAIDWKVLFKIGENWRNGAYILFILRALKYSTVLSGRCVLQTLEPSTSAGTVAQDVEPTDSEGEAPVNPLLPLLNLRKNRCLG